MLIRPSTKVCECPAPSVSCTGSCSGLPAAPAEKLGRRSTLLCQPCNSGLREHRGQGCFLAGSVHTHRALQESNLGLCALLQLHKGGGPQVFRQPCGAASKVLCAAPCCSSLVIKSEALLGLRNSGPTAVQVALQDSQRYQSEKSMFEELQRRYAELQQQARQAGGC